MATFVLVPGFWLGGWAWRSVARSLRAGGHDVYPVTLTGLGDRVHLASPEVDLETHITDVVNLIEFEGLHDVVLVGHSGGGLPVTGVSDRIPRRLAKVVYVESGELPDGAAFLDTNPPEARAEIMRQVESLGDGWRLPLPSWESLGRSGASLDGLGDAERAAMRERAVPQPAGTLTQPLKLSNPARRDVPRALIACSFPLAMIRQLAGDGVPMFAALAEPGWELLELPTGHWPMFSRPADLAELLAGLV
jgi:pimeloyl-ACP methyl ester carboxylesterase